jgi:hypothetical protein
MIVKKSLAATKFIPAKRVAARKLLPIFTYKKILATAGTKLAGIYLSFFPFTCKEFFRCKPVTFKQ